eukprot:gene6250-4499_t
MKVKCSLEDFLQRARELHEGRLQYSSTSKSSKRPAGGIKRTRLMVRIRPKDNRKTLVLKVTDGQTTYTTRVEHYGQLSLVEKVLNEFFLIINANNQQKLQLNESQHSFPHMKMLVLQPSDKINTRLLCGNKVARALGSGLLEILVGALLFVFLVRGLSFNCTWEAVGVFEEKGGGGWVKVHAGRMVAWVH